MGGWEGGVKPRRLTCYPAPAPILLLLVRVLLKITVQCYYKLSILLHKVVLCKMSSTVIRLLLQARLLL